MSYFRNVQNNGVWNPGGTYTFEADLRSKDGWTGKEFPCRFFASGFGLYTSNDVLNPPTNCYGCLDSACWPQFAYKEEDYLFDNNNEDFTGGVDGSTVSSKELEDGWMKYTVQLAEDLPNGTYYFKGRRFYWEYDIA